MDIQGIISARLKDRRERMGLTQARLAEQANVSVELVSRIERGRCLPSLSTLVSFSQVLKTSPDRLLGFEEKNLGEYDDLLQVINILPKARVKEIKRIAEALVSYERVSTE